MKMKLLEKSEIGEVLQQMQDAGMGIIIQDFDSREFIISVPPCVFACPVVGKDIAAQISGLCFWLCENLPENDFVKWYKNFIYVPTGIY